MAQIIRRGLPDCHGRHASECDFCMWRPESHELAQNKKLTNMESVVKIDHTNEDLSCLLICKFWLIALMKGC